uniref:Sushi domain-containing protein n=1 Tax=Strigamia maritima TaxID=126957 RepID=T1ILG2_STRMM
MRVIELIIYFFIYCSYGKAQSYVPSYVSCGLTACDVLTTMRQEITDKRYDRQLWEFKAKLELVTSMEYKFADISVEFDRMNYEFLEFKEEFRNFMDKHNNKPEASTLLHSKDNPDQRDIKDTNHETKLIEIEEKLERSLDNIESVKSLKSEIELLKKEIAKERHKNEVTREETEQQVKELQKENLNKINQVEILLNDTQNVQKESRNDIERKIQQLHDVKISLKNQLDDHMVNSSEVSIVLEQQMEHLLNKTKAEIADFKISVLTHNNVSAAEFDNKISEVSNQVTLLQQEFMLVQQVFNKSNSELSSDVDNTVSEVTYQVTLLQGEILMLQQNVTTSKKEILNVIENKADKKVLLDVARIANSTQKVEVALEDNEKKLTKLQREVGVYFQQTSKLQNVLEQVRKETTDNALSKKEFQTELKALIKKTMELELDYKEMKDKLEKTQEKIRDLMKDANSFQKDEINKDKTVPQPSYITLSDERASCIHYNYNPDVIASLDGRPITTTVQTVPHGKSVEFRCRDPGAFKFHVSTSRQCIDGNWTNSYPVCGPLVTLDQVKGDIGVIPTTH